MAEFGLTSYIIRAPVAATHGVALVVVLMVSGRVMGWFRISTERRYFESRTRFKSTGAGVSSRAIACIIESIVLNVRACDNVQPPMTDAPTADWLERANRLALTSALLSTTVHEVNNALQVISGSAEMLHASPPPDVMGRRTDAIGAHARRASALLAELSAFAKDDSTAPIVLDLAQIGQRALSMRQYTIAKLKLESVFETAGDIRTVVANHRPLLQIVLNLVINAEQALAQRSGGRIALSVRGESGCVRLAVEDDGPGVTPDAVPHLFTPLAFAGDGRLGIGLSVARHLAGRYGGTVVYASRPDGGSRFTLTLPAAQ